MCISRVHFKVASLITYVLYVIRHPDHSSSFCPAQLQHRSMLAHILLNAGTMLSSEDHLILTLNLSICV